MPNFDFHNNLSAIEFERLVRDVLQQKYKGYTFRSYKAGKDGGIDIKSMGGSKLIICQTKLYQQSFAQLQRSVQKELIKVRKLKPHRYILATSCSLTNENIQVILKDLSGIPIKEEDIWDKERLNQMLGLPEFKDVLKNHFKLFLTDLVVLEETIRKTVNNAIIQYSLIELEQIQHEVRYYVETKIIQEIQKKLLKERIVIISGAAGTGKTTAARMIINTLLNTTKTIEFFKTTTIDETLSCFDPSRSQIFFLDDYWGQFMEKIHEPNTTKSDKLVSFLERIKRSSKHYVIITSRDYILKDEGIVRQIILNTTINKHLSIIKIKELTFQEKAKIFIQHLYHSDLDRTFLSHLYYSEHLKQIAEHQNFNPRLVNQFIYQVFPQKVASDAQMYDNYIFYREFYDYLRNPNEYWEHLLNVQTDSGRLILMILVISGGYISFKELQFTYEKCIPLALNKGIQIKISDFTSTIKSLDDTFIDIYGFERINDCRISFKNGSIGDYLVTYLQKNLIDWGTLLIEGSAFFEQLTTIFSTQESKEEKIHLMDRNKGELKARLLPELFVLPDNLTNLNKENYFSKGQLTYRLFKLTDVFNINEESDVRQFLLEKTNIIIVNQISQGEFPLDRNNLSTYASLINTLKFYLNIDVSQFLESLFFSIDYFEDYEDFIKFSSVYPDEYNSFLKKNKKEIRPIIEGVLLDDIDYYMEVDQDYIENITEFNYDTILQGLKLKHSTKFNNEVFRMYGIYLRRPLKHFKSVRKSNNRRTREKQKRKTAAGNKKTYINLLKQFIIEKVTNDHQDVKRSTPFDMEIYHTQTLQNAKFLNPTLNEKQLETFLKQVAYDDLSNYRHWYTLNELKNKLLEGSTNLIESLDLSEIMVQQEKWYSFPNGDYLNYLTVLHCNSITEGHLYSEAIEDLLIQLDPEETENIIRLFIQTNEPKFWSDYLKESLNEIFSKVELLTTSKKIQTFVEITDWKMEAHFKKYKGKVSEIDSLGGSGGDWTIEALASIVTGDGSYLGFDQFFYQLNDQVKSNPVLIEKFETYCRQHLKTGFWNISWTIPSKKLKYYTLILSEHLQKPEFWEIAVESGWVNGIEKTIDGLLEYKIAMEKKYPLA